MKALPYPGIRIQQVADPRARAALTDLDGHLRAMNTLLNSLVSTDEGRGLLRTEQPTVVPEAPADPTTRSTYGRVGELRRVADRIYMKVGSSGEDRNWSLIQPGSPPSGGFHDPTALVQLSAVNGTATTMMRSDAAPALSQSIAPNWTREHAWSQTTNVTPITVHKTASLTSAPLLDVLDLDGSILLDVNNVGLVGINGAPDAFLTIWGGGLAPPITSNLKAWYHADSITSLSNGQDVVTWQDSSGNGYHLTAAGNTTTGAGSATRPKWYAAGQPKAIPNLPSVSFEATISPDNFGYFTIAGGTLPLTAASGWTLCFIWRDYNAIANAARLLGVTYSDLNDNYITVDTTGGGGSPDLEQAYTEEGPSIKYFSNNAGHTEGNDTERIILRCESSSNGNKLRAWVDGALIPSTGNAGNPYTRTTDVFFRFLGAFATGGAPGSWGGAYGKALVELLIYDRELTNTEVASIDSYLSSRVSGTTSVLNYDLAHFKDSVGNTLSRIDAAGQFGLGVQPAYPLDIRAQGTQQRWGPDGSNYLTLAVGATGTVVLDAVGAGAGVQFPDHVGIGIAPGTTGVLKIDTTSQVASPNIKLSNSGFFTGSISIQDTVGGMLLGVDNGLQQVIAGSPLSLANHGHVISGVPDGGSAVVFDLEDSISRTVETETAFRIRNSAIGGGAGTLLMVTNAMGQTAYGYNPSLVPQTGHVLSFLYNTSGSFALTGAYSNVGMIGQIIHNNTVDTAPPTLYGVVGAVVSATSSKIATSAFDAGLVGSAGCTVDTASMAGRVLAGVVANIYGGTSVTGGHEPTLKDYAFGSGETMVGSYDHVAGLWVQGIGLKAMGTWGTNFPLILSGARIPIQYAASKNIGTPQGETWGVYGEFPSPASAVAVYPTQTGYMRAAYPRSTGASSTRAMHIQYEPWPITTTIFGSQGKGDTSFSSGTNVPTGLYEHDGTSAFRIRSTWFTSTADAGPSNTATETSLKGTGVGVSTLPANWFVAGRTIRIAARGWFETAAVPGTLTIKFKLGSTTVATTTAKTPGASVGLDGWSVDLLCTCRTTGATGTVYAQGCFEHGDGTTANEFSWYMVNNATTTIDTTVAEAVDVTATWGTADPSNVLTCTDFVVEVLN